MKKIFILLIIFSSFSCVLAAKNSYKGASTVTLLDSLSFHIDEDMRMVKQRFLRIKILEKRGREEKGDLRARFNEDSQNFEIVSAHTITPSGEIIEPVESGISLVSAPEVGYASQYTNLKMQVVSFPALEPGAIIECNYRIISEEEIEKPFAANITLQAEEPIKKKIISLTFPEEENDHFAFNVIGTKLKPVISEGDDQITYKFEMSDLAKINFEPSMPSIPEISPELRFTFYSEWDEFVENYQENFFDAAKPSRSLKKQLKKIPGRNLEEKIENIAIFVKQDIRSIYLKFGQSGFEPTKAKKILSNRYGDPQDKALLLTTFLRQIDVEAYPVLLAAKQVKDLESALPIPALMKNILVAYKLKGKCHYIDPSSPFCKPNWIDGRYQNREAIAIFPEDFEFITTPQTAIDASRSKVSLNAKLDKSGSLKGTFHITARGYFDTQLRKRLRYKNSDELDIFFKGIAANIQGGTDLLDYRFTNPEDLKKPMKINLQFKTENYLTKQGTRLKFSIPRLGMPSTEIADYSNLKEREYPLVLGTEREYNITASIKFPDDFELLYSPRIEGKINDSANFKITSSEKNSTFQFSSEFKILSERVPIKKYPKFRKLQNDYFNQNNWLVIFK